MFKKKESKKKETKETPRPTNVMQAKYSVKVKQRAFELYMQVFPNELRRRYTQQQIAEMLRKEFKDTEDVSKIHQGYICNWIHQYGWDGNYAAAMERAKATAADELQASELYTGIATGMRANIVGVDKIIRAVDQKLAVAQQIDRLSGVMTSIIVDMFMVNKQHTDQLLRTRSGGGWVYDCDRYGTRKQLFDMWMAGSVKLMDLFGLMPPKKTTLNANLKKDADGNTSVSVDSTALDGVNLNDNNFELILKLWGLEQTKGGFGHELTGPSNADFPSTAGSAKPVESGKEGSDS